MNGIIKNMELEFTDVNGKCGRNFTLKLTIKTNNGGVICTFNPMRLPQLLEELELEKYSDLKDTPVIIMNTNFGEECGGIKHFLKENGKWFKTENHIYFGSQFFKGYDVNE